MAKQSSSGLKELLNDPTVVSSVAERQYSMSTQSLSDLKELLKVSSVAERQYSMSTQSLSDLKELLKVSSVAEVRYSWSDLPEDAEYILLDLILEHLTDFSDLIRCRGVCHSWGFAAARKLCGNNHVVPPLLLLCTRKTIILSRDYGKKLEVSASTNTTKVFDLPKIFHFGSIPCTSSHRGWLLLLQLKAKALPSTVYKTIVPPESPSELLTGTHHHKTTKITLSQFSSHPDPDETTPLYLFNPYSRILVKLQQPPLPLCINGRLRFIMSCTASDPNCIIYAYNLCSCSVAFYGLRDRKWSPLFTSNNRPVDAIFYKGHFCAVDNHGVLRRLLFDMDYNSSYKEEVVSVNIGDTTPHRYLVEESSSSSGGGVLMMVVRKFDLETMKTNFFEIFKMDWSNGKWEEVSSLGDQALFLAHNGSKLVSVSIHNPEYRQNTIYFVDDVVKHGNSHRKDFGLYDLGNHKIQPLNVSSKLMDLPHCRWFQPAV